MANHASQRSRETSPYEKLSQSLADQKKKWCDSPRLSIEPDRATSTKKKKILKEEYTQEDINELASQIFTADSPATKFIADKRKSKNEKKTKKGSPTAPEKKQRKKSTKKCKKNESTAATDKAEVVDQDMVSSDGIRSLPSVKAHQSDDAEMISGSNSSKKKTGKGKKAKASESLGSADLVELEGQILSEYEDEEVPM